MIKYVWHATAVLRSEVAHLNPGVINALLTFLYISRFATSCAFVPLDCKLRRSWVASVLFFAARIGLSLLSFCGNRDCYNFLTFR